MDAIRYVFALWMVALVAGACAVYSVQPYPAATTYEHAAEYAFEYACEAAGFDCSQLEPPKVRYADLLGLIQAHGYYWYSRDTNTVWLDLSYEEDPWNWFAVAVLIHETTHYVHRHVDPDLTSCETEALAFQIEHQYLLQINHPEKVWEKWYLQYGCEAP